jgi:hypothetical protein
MQCTSKRTGKEFWKVKLDTGEWVWPEDLVQDGIGDCLTRCGDCGMRFLSNGLVSGMVRTIARWGARMASLNPGSAFNARLVGEGL